MAHSAIDHLSVYLNDHLAGSTTALELLDVLHDDPKFLPRDVVVQLRTDIADDRDVLLDLMARLRIPVSDVRKAGGWLGEKLVRLKVSLDDPADGALRHLELLELLSLGIEGKRTLWASLATGSASAELGALDFAALSKRAEKQRADVERYRLSAAAAAFDRLTSAN